MDECKVCANADNEYCFACDNGNQFKPMTNADKLRGMTDEELAKYLLNRDLGVVGQLSKLYTFIYKIDRESCLANILDWLRKEDHDA